MTDEIKQPEGAEAETPTPVEETPAVTPAAAPAPAATPAAPQKSSRFAMKAGGGRGGFGQRRGPGGGPGGARRRPGAEAPVESDYEEKNVEVARVTRVTKGGKRMRFRTLSVIGNRKGRVGFGLAKGLDVAASTAKATTKARKALLTVPLIHDTIPHQVEGKFSAARVLLKPAPKGTGVKAGGSVRVVLELAGVPNVVSKSLGSKNKINNVKATFAALRKLRLPPPPKEAAAS